MDRWKTFPVVCKGGLDLYTDVLTQGLQNPGIARQLTNYEPAVEGGYQRVLGYQKWDTNVVPGTAGNPVLAVKPALGGVFAVRKNSSTNDNAIFFSSGSSWSKKNSTTRPGNVTKARIIAYSIFRPVIIAVDGVNPAWKYDGTTETVINGTGAPTNPKYAAEHLKRLALAGYSSNISAVSLSAPNNDTDFSGVNGAIEFTVGDAVVGLKTFRGELYIFCKNSIHKLVGSTSNDFRIEPVTKSIGCVAPDSIQEVGGDLVFLAPDGLRSVAATARIGDIELGILSKNIQPILREALDTFTSENFSSCVVRAKSQYRLFYYDSALDDGSQLALLGRLESRSDAGIVYAWSQLKGFPAGCSESAYEEENERALFGHPTNGFVYIMESGNSFDGSDITHIYQTPQLFFDDPEIRKVLYKLKIYTQVAGEMKTVMNVLFDFEKSNILQPPSQPLSSNTVGFVYGTAVYGTDLYGFIDTPIFDLNLVGSGFSASISFSDTNQKAPHRIDSFTIEYKVAGRR